MKRPNLRIIGIEEELQLKITENIFNKIIEENFSNLKKAMPMKVKEAYRTGLSSQGPDEEQKEGKHEQGSQDREGLVYPLRRWD